MRYLRVVPWISLLTAGFLLLGDFARASDFLYEKQLSETVATSVDQGEMVWLQDGQRSFLAIFSESETKKVHGAAVILTGIAEHPDSQGVVHDLRTHFPKKRWASISLQMPVRRPGSSFQSHLELIDGSASRIRSAVEYIATKNIDRVVLIGHGLGGLMALDYLGQEPDPRIKALVLISTSIPDESRFADPLIATLKKINLPTLDIYAAYDLEPVTSGATNRRKATKNNPEFRQVMFFGADHGFPNSADLLFKRIHSWLLHSPGPVDANQ